MPDNEKEKAPAAPKHDGGVEVASAHNTPPNQAETGEVNLENTEETQNEC